MSNIKLINKDCLIALKTLEDNSVDSIVTDPPYELGFMGKSWDSTGIANNVEVWKECLRVLKPGGHLLAFSGTRTYHRMAVAIEDAGFEVRDMIEWVYGSGFPKSLNIGKAIDKLQGNEREETGEYQFPDGLKRNSLNDKGTNQCNRNSGNPIPKNYTRTKGTSEYEGWGTALKPAHEPICMARKPLAEKTIAQNVLKYGTGGINIDESRVGTEERYNPASRNKAGGNSLNMSAQGMPQDAEGTTAIGRFPANLIHDNSEEVRACFPETKSGRGITKRKNKDEVFDFGQGYGREEISDSGNASRFFKSIIYNPKTSKTERNAGCDNLEERQLDESRLEGNPGGNNPRNRGVNKATNFHPTVKPIALMEYLIKMVTPLNGTVLDPFMGSGSTGVAAKKNGYNFIGIDMTPEYVEIAKARIDNCNENLL